MDEHILGEGPKRPRPDIFPEQNNNIQLIDSTLMKKYKGDPMHYHVAQNGVNANRPIRNHMTVSFSSSPY